MYLDMTRYIHINDEFYKTNEVVLQSSSMYCVKIREKYVIRRYVNHGSHGNSVDVLYVWLFSLLCGKFCGAFPIRTQIWIPVRTQICSSYKQA
jgi:hypothetical protein